MNYPQFAERIYQDETPNTNLHFSSLPMNAESVLRGVGIAFWGGFCFTR